MPDPTTTYRERLVPAWWLWALAGFLALSGGVAFLAVLGPGGSLLVTLALGGLAAWALWSWTATVEVAGAELRAGRARIPVRLTGPAVPLDAERAAHVRGAGIDPSAYHFIRGWVGTAVLVEVIDPRDPTPYWYVSTRHPSALVAALDAARAAA